MKSTTLRTGTCNLFPCCVLFSEAVKSLAGILLLKLQWHCVPSPSSTHLPAYFISRYGVPYFKDSTPSWSTRGKLRNQLVPLLLDMYGSGCLHNLAALARESDLTRDLVQTNLYEPFLRLVTINNDDCGLLRFTIAMAIALVIPKLFFTFHSSVSRHSCGLSVNVLPYRQQPQCFWREALKQLMHSMNMPMVRDSAVGNFVERLQKPSARLLAGWLELRKGVHSFLTEVSCLFCG